MNRPVFNSLMSSLLYTISGLPVHALVVHFAVVLLPLATASMVAAIYVPKYKTKYALASLIGVFLGTGAAVIAKQSGEELAARIGTPQTHARIGSLLPYLAIVFFFAALIWVRRTRNRRAHGMDLFGNITALLGVGVIALTFLVGHTGAQAVWRGKLEAIASANKYNATAQASPTPTAKSGAKTISMAIVRQHSTPTSCWTVINGNVYNLTKWISRHPGGSSVIKATCGRDASSSFNNQHSGQPRPEQQLASFKIGVLG